MNRREKTFRKRRKQAAATLGILLAVLASSCGGTDYYELRCVTGVSASGVEHTISVARSHAPIVWDATERAWLVDGVAAPTGAALCRVHPPTKGR